MHQEHILEILTEWNFWRRPLPATVERRGYEREIVRKASAGEIVVLKGVRRSGKSTLLLNVIRNLQSGGTSPAEILFVNLEDPRFGHDLHTGLLQEIKEAYLEYLSPRGKPWIFLDEIQNVEGFEKWLTKEYELGESHLLVTGSNARLLGNEIGTALSGRYLDTTVYPLSFSEFLRFKDIPAQTPVDLAASRLSITQAFNEYIEYGGFPKVALVDSADLKKDELKAYFDSILLRDVAARHNLDRVDTLMRLAVLLLSQTGNLMSLNSLKNTLRLSFDLVDRYVSYLESAMLVHRLSRFNWSLKSQQVSPKKIYAVDQGLSNRVSFKSGANRGRVLENVVFLELARRHQEVYYYKTRNGLEVDFLVLARGKVTHLIQVTAEMEQEQSRKREIRALQAAAAELGDFSEAELLILTPGRSEVIEIEGGRVQVRNLLQWLLASGA